MKQVTVVIPTLPERAAELEQTCLTLQAQTLAHLLEIVIVVDTERRGQGWARNQGVSTAARIWPDTSVIHSPYLLFSDDDIHWHPTAVERLLVGMATARGRDAWVPAYAYGSYRLTGCPVGVSPGPYCTESWSWSLLKRRNFVSTMSLIRWDSFMYFDESLPMLEDWDLWLELGSRGLSGVQVKGELFTTPYRVDGVTFGKEGMLGRTIATIQRKHRLVA